MTLGSERGAVQNPMLRYAREAGWTYVPPQEALRLRRGETGLVFHEVLVSLLQRLNPGVVDLNRAEELTKRLARVPPTIEGNLQTWEYLKGVKTVFVEEERQERNVQFLDANDERANVFQVTDEFEYFNGTKRDRADVVFLINGIPVLIVETKSALLVEGIAEALDQIRRYHREVPEFLALLQLHALTHLIQYYYGATWNLNRQGLFNWRDEQAGDYETLVKTFVQPTRVLRVLSEFILFTRKDDELTKVVLRPHQMRAVERIVSRAKDAKKRRGLVWHTQGSGKTYSMITVAKQLIEDPALENPTVLLLVDRNELEAQLFGNLEAVGFGHVEVAETKEHLRRLLQTGHRGLIVTMIHKFEGMPANANVGERVYVLVDEAHRTTGGGLGNYLMGALPNATYIGFTGTPVDRTAHGKGTFKIFGKDDPKGYLDKYSIRDSILDGTTVPLHYALAPNDLLVKREVLEKEFFSLAELEGVSDVEELNRVLDRAVTLKNMLKNRERVAKVAAFVAKHYRETVAPMGYKAFLVAVDREACVFYKEALDKFLPPEVSTVVMSRGHNDEEHLAKAHLSDDAEKKVRKAFRRPDENPQILIVTEKLLTGYDAPILYCMYLDKPMRDHVLLQAIARVNRPYEDDEGRRKRAGLIIDFVGVFSRLEKALAFDSEDVEGVVQGIDVLQARFRDQIAEGKKAYLTLGKGLKGDKAVEGVLEHFRDADKRQAFFKYFRELEELYEILSPDPFLRPFLVDYDDLVRMYRIVKAAFEPNVTVDKSFLRKTAELVQKHTKTGEVGDLTKKISLDLEALNRIVGDKKPDTVKVFNLIKALYQLVQQDGVRAPYLLSIGERAEQIAQAFEDRQIDAKGALAQLAALVKEYDVAEKSRKGSDLSAEGFALYWILDRKGLKGADRVAHQVSAAFTSFPHWRRSEDQERSVRKAIYMSMGDLEIEDVATVVDRFLALLRRMA